MPDVWCQLMQQVGDGWEGTEAADVTEAGGEYDDMQSSEDQSQQSEVGLTPGTPNSSSRSSEGREVVVMAALGVAALGVLGLVVIGAKKLMSTQMPKIQKVLTAWLLFILAAPCIMAHRCCAFRIHKCASSMTGGKLQAKAGVLSIRGCRTLRARCGAGTKSDCGTCAGA